MTHALPRRMFIANRGEVAVRIARACAELGLESVAALSEDEAQAPHLKKADRVQSLGAAGVRAWLDAARPNAVARRRKTNQRTARENVADLPDPCLCHRRRLPLVLFSDGGGGRPGDKDFINSGGLDTPSLTVVTRKGHGLGAKGMAAGGFENTRFTVAWATGEFVGMGLEGFVRLGFRDTPNAIADPGRARGRKPALGGRAGRQGRRPVGSRSFRHRRRDRPRRDPALDRRRARRRTLAPARGQAPRLDRRLMSPLPLSPREDP